MTIAEYTIGIVAMAAMIITVLTIGTLASAELLPRVKRNREAAESKRRAVVARSERENPDSAVHHPAPHRHQHAA